ncbi:hypothetical protein imdm_325 [gamma proteobacterium IMCC2047]|nr:hypothetical protein imdm_325 [gamma proteobacterium IMCC2047]
MLFQGEVLLFRGVPALFTLIDYADRLLKKHLGDIDPTTVQKHLDETDYLTLMGNAQYEFRTAKQPKTLFFEALRQVGVDPNTTYWDHFPLRAVPCGQSHRGGRCGWVDVHRDSWGSTIDAQLNWWAPIYPLEPERSMAFYPDYWHQPLANDTATWSIDEYIRQRNLLPNQELKVPYSSVPLPIEPVDDSNVCPVMLEPGDLLCFSSAHLHASMPNTTDRTRFSVEMRTVNINEVLAGNGAPNVDNAGPKPMYQWFRRISDNSSLQSDMEVCMSSKAR